MSLVYACALPHPPIMIPEVGRGQETEIAATIAAYRRVAAEITDKKPDLLVLVSPHAPTRLQTFLIHTGERCRGDFSRFGAWRPRIGVHLAPDWAAVLRRAAEKEGIPARLNDCADEPLDHGSLIPLYFLGHAGFTAPSSDDCDIMLAPRLLPLSFSGRSPSEHIAYGKILAGLIARSTEKVAFIASGDLSHKLTESGPYGFSSDGPPFDRRVTEMLKHGDFDALSHLDEAFCERAAECGWRSLLILSGLLSATVCESELLSYEGPFGVGYAVAAFRPPSGRETFSFKTAFAQNTQEKKPEEGGEDAWVCLARRSLGYYLRHGSRIKLTDDEWAELPAPMREQRAGVFVSLHLDGRLRGCIGTIEATTESIADEIIGNAISAGTCDPRFPAVTEDEAPRLEVSVDVLSKAFPVTDPATLDPQRYGVIVSRDFRRGLLLPRLEGVDSVEEQIDIARRKAGIGADEAIALEAFEVVRHEKDCGCGENPTRKDDD